MKKKIFLLLVNVSVVASSAQLNRDSLKQLLKTEKADTTRVSLLASIGYAYLDEKPEIGLTYAQQGLDLARTINDKTGEGWCLLTLGALYRVTGNYTTGIKYHLVPCKYLKNLTNSLELHILILELQASMKTREIIPNLYCTIIKQNPFLKPFLLRKV